MKTNIKQFVLIAAILSIFLHFGSFAFAEQGNGLPLPDVSNFGTVPGGTKVAGDSAIEQFAGLVGGFRSGQGGLFGIARNIIGAIAVLMIIINALRMLFAQGEEGTVEKAKNGIIYGLMGLALVSIAGELTKVLSLSEEGIKAAYNGETAICQKTLLSDTSALQCRAKIFSRTVQILITFVKYLLGSLAVAQVIASSYRLVTIGGEPEKLGEDKKKLLWAGLGFFLVLFADTAINKVFYKLNYNTYTGIDGVKPAVDPAEGIRQIVGFTNYIVAILGPLAILMLIVGAVMYMAAAGEDTKIQQAKRLIFAALIGIVVIYGAFGVVSTIIAGKFG